MKKNEYDILFNDELYEFVYSIFHTLVYKTKVYGIEKNC